MAFVLLPKEKRTGMSALYAFCREVDDVADDAAVPAPVRLARLQEWRADVRRACAGAEPVMAVNRELVAVIERYRLPFEYFDEILTGVEMDVHAAVFESYPDLDRYCYRVASAVGLLSIEIFGYAHPGARQYAIYLGKALQMTNILRDVGNDAERGRIYIPREELRRFEVAPEEIFGRVYSDRFAAMAASVASRARAYYELAREFLPLADRRSMVAAELMGTVYWELLQLLERSRFQVLDGVPMRVDRASKLGLILRTWWRNWIGSAAANYGEAQAR